jgi:hypothetical protein
MSENLNLEHYGPEPHLGAGPKAMHYNLHEHAVGKTIARVYLGQCAPITSPGVLPQSEYTVFEFTDGSTLMLQIGAGYSFALGDNKAAQKVIARAKQRDQHNRN